MPRNHLPVSGNALLITLLMTTLLLIMTLGISSLVSLLSTNLQSQTNGYRAYYAAEAGTEMALYSIKTQLPGFEYAREQVLPLDPLTSVRYSIFARTRSVPVSGYRVLPSGQSVTLALFRDEGQNGVQAAKDLLPGNAFTLAVQSGSAVPCLKWAVFGFREQGTELVSETMGDILCGAQGNRLNLTSTGKFKDSGGTYFPNHPIQNFLSTHRQNSLTITNIMPAAQNLEYQLSFANEPFADDAFEILAHGQYRQAVQQLSARVPLARLLPLFYFAIFDQ